jgi:hypothetical protein
MNEVELVLTAQDRASPVVEKARALIVDQYGGALVLADERTRKHVQSLDLLDGASAKAARSVRNLALPLVSELTPAMSATTAQITNVVAASSMATTIWGTLAIAAAGLAGVVGGELLRAWREGARAKKEWNEAMMSGDVGQVAGAVKKKADEVRQLTREIDELNKRVGSRGWALLYGPALRQRTGKERERAATLAEETEGRAVQRGLDLGEDLAQAEILAAQGLRDLELGRSRRSFELRRSQAGLYDFLLTRPGEADFRAAERQAEELRNEGQVAAAERLMAAARLKLRTTRAEYDLQGSFLGPELAGATTQAQLDLQGHGVLVTSATMAAIREQVERLEVERARLLPLPTQAERLAQAEISAEAQLPQALASADTGLVESERQALELASRRAEILSRQYGLTEKEREALELQAIEAERLLKIHEALGDQRKTDLANLDATVKTTSVLRQQLERDDPLAGFAKGWREAAETAEASGRIMTDVARQSSQAITRAYQDGLFNVVTGEFKKLPDVAKAMSQQLLRAVTDALGQAMMAPLHRTLADFFGGAPGSPGSPFFGGNLVVPPGAAVPPGYQVVGSTDAGGQHVLIAAPSSPGSAYTFGPGGQHGLAVRQLAGIDYRGLYTGLYDRFTTPGYGEPRDYGSSYAAYQSYRAGERLDYTGYAIDSYGADFGGGVPDVDPGVSYGADFGGGVEGAGGGMSWGQVMGYAAIAVEVAKRAYNIAMIAQSEGYEDWEKAILAFDQVALGVASYYTFGLSTILENFFTISSLFKPAIPHHVREAREANRLYEAGNQLVNELFAAKDTVALYETLTKWTSGYLGGTNSPAVMSGIGGPGARRYFGKEELVRNYYGPGQGLPYASLEDLFAHYEDVWASAQQGIAPHLLDPANQNITAAIRDAFEAAARQEADTGPWLSYDEVLPARRAPYGPTTRRTELAFNRRYEAKGFDLSVLGEALRALSAEDKKRFLIELAKIDKDFDLRIIYQDDSGPLVVSHYSQS